MFVHILLFHGIQNTKPPPPTRFPAMHPLSRRHLRWQSAAAFLLTALPRCAASGLVPTERNGTALDGYDTTAYWQTAGPLKCRSARVVLWQNIPWMFASQDAADLFAATPDAFAPQFGGHCTRAMSLGKIVQGDPEVWRIYQGSLNLFAKPIGGERFDEGQDAMIALAQAFWVSFG
jgi:hypothetical protein